MGFPNKGLLFVRKQLQALPSTEKRPAPVFVNIGKNRDTPFEKAFKDYQISIKALSPYTDAFVINISSPNTKGLRAFFDRKKSPLLFTCATVSKQSKKNL